MKKNIKLIIFIIVTVLNVKTSFAYYFYNNNENWTGNYHEYNDDVEVITAVEVYTPYGFPRQSKRPHERKDDEAKAIAINKTGECIVSFSGACGSKNQQGAIAMGESRLFWVKWKTPKIDNIYTEKIETISVNVPAGAYILINGELKTSITITCKIYKPKYKTPPDTNYDDYQDESNIELYAPIDRMQDILEKSFHTYTYKWEPDWHYVCTRSGNEEDGYPEDGSYAGWNSDITCMEHECPEDAENHECPKGDCSIQAQDWGEVIWEKHEHCVALQITSHKLQHADNTPYPDESPREFDLNRIETIRSGYGIWYRFNCSSIYKFPGNVLAIQYDIKNYFTHPQVLIYYYPEFNFDTYADRAYSWDGDNEPTCSHYGLPNFHTMKFETPNNPYSHFDNWVHYIPIYFPDGPYEVLAEVSSCFCPAGELTLSGSQYMEIEGSLWDDLHIKQGN